jgi:hypothetical protein
LLNQKERDMRHKRIPTLALSAFILAGCTTVYEGKYNFSDGWREARVVKVGGATEIGKKPRSLDCLESATAQQLSTSQFAVLSFMAGTRSRMRVVPLRSGEAFGPGDLVYMNVKSCDTALVAREKQAAK